MLECQSASADLIAGRIGGGGGRGWGGGRCGEFLCPDRVHRNFDGRNKERRAVFGGF